MRPTLAALHEQQQILSGIRTTADRREAMHRTAFDQLREQNRSQGLELTALRKQNAMLGRGLRMLAQMAGVEGHIAAAMFRMADVQNPAQPIPEPPAVPPTQTTQEVKTPEAQADAQTPGMVGGSTQDVAADKVTTVYTPGGDFQGAPLKNLIDVTAPVDGTQNPRPLSEVRTETDVRAGNPMNPQVAFPLRGDFQQGQNLRNAASLQGDPGGRMVAALRLARLRLATGTAQGVNDIEVATGIEKDATLSIEAIEREIATLDGVTKAASKRPGGSNRGLVPTRAAAGVQRTVPSMQGGTPQSQPTPHTGGLTPMSVSQEVADADLFS